MKYLTQKLKTFIRSKGYTIERWNDGYTIVPVTPRNDFVRDKREKFYQSANLIGQRHKEQTAEVAADLKKKYEKAVFGKFTIWSLVEASAQCIDPLDYRLFCGSQQVHILQMLEGMEQDGITDKDMLIAAILHDLGKVLLAPHEPPENVFGVNLLCGEYEEGIGLDNCIFQWNHDEFIYSRLKDHVPDHIAWLLRYHSTPIAQCEPFMDERDRTYTEHYLRAFAKYDFQTKCIYNIPQKRIEDYRDLVEEAFPNPILF
jgi:hypothetical protein